MGAGFFGLVRSISSWVGQHPIPAATILGATFYAIVRASLTSFYGAFGLEPEDVGLGYTDVLVRAVAGLLILLFIGLGPLALAAVATIVFQRKGLGPLFSDRFLAIYAAFWVLAGLSFTLLGLQATANYSAARVRSGTSVRPAQIPHLLDLILNPLAIRAEPVTVEWLGSDEPRTLENCNCKLMYLGRSSGVVALYDVRHGRTLRLPESELVVARER
jgi:hypothetical protein